MIVSKTFSANGVNTAVLVKKGDGVYVSLSGTYAGTITLEKSKDQVVWEVVVQKTAANSTIEALYINDGQDAQYRIRCTAYDSGNAVTKMISYYASKTILAAAGLAKAGAAAGFVVAAGDDKALVTCPASQTGSTLVLPIPYLKPGQVIKGFHLLGQVESAGNAVTVDTALRVMTSAAADVSDAAVFSAPQVSVTADAILGYKNSLADGFTKVVNEDETYYFLITATTGASTDVALQGVALIIE